MYQRQPEPTATQKIAAMMQAGYTICTQAGDDIINGLLQESALVQGSRIAKAMSTICILTGTLGTIREALVPDAVSYNENVVAFALMFSGLALLRNHGSSIREMEIVTEFAKHRARRRHLGR